MNIGTASSNFNYLNLSQGSPAQSTLSAQVSTGQDTEQSKALELKQDKEQQESDDKKIQELKDRDREVRLHEQAHAAVGGQYAGAPSYDFETGPDGKQYAVGGEVSIDVSEANKPEDTIDKMQVVRAAALAPAEPSPQDFKVAAEAQQKEQAARAEVAKQAVEKDTNDPGTSSSQATSTANSRAINAYNSHTEFNPSEASGSNYNAFA
ncbi:putative metalloprotease CJM1_0395 family protein [Ningiella sp. W23]|uniref:putative metalloprotease CJM1_0395 family protein n=1 Tax=Ningiella sp. W23 TaxID=3023715 RepID=UPI003757FC65